jgi:alkaline phosphatase D
LPAKILGEMKRFILWILILKAVFVFGQQSEERPYVILISFDGFRYDYVKNFNPPNFQLLISNGSHAEALIPSFPSKTFPNHYSIVTGLNPGTHGLVDNSFYDRARNTFYGMRDKPKVVDGYYYGGVPLWELAKRNGVKSASYFWVGSELSDPSRRPDYYFPFNDSIPPLTRVNQVIDWLKLPEKDRPHLITLYFSFPDHEGHEFGPNSVETQQAVLRGDTLLGKLLKGVEETKLPVNFILVSDHGMVELTTSVESSIFLDELINKKDPAVKFSNGGTQTHLYISEGKKIDSVFSVLNKPNNQYKVTRKENFPDRWHYKNERSGEILIEAKPGFYIRDVSRERFVNSAKMGTKFGVHGYDPAVTNDVRGIFYAYGPNIKRGIALPPFQNIHVYPLIAKILNLPLPEIDGKESVLKPIYKVK